MSQFDPKQNVPTTKNLKNSLLYTTGNYWDVVGGVISSLVTRAIITPLAFGAHSYVYGIYTYAHLYNKIWRNAIAREVPLATGQGQPEKAQHVLDVSYSILLASVLLESSVFAVVAFLTGNTFMRLAFLTLAATNLFVSISSAHNIYLKNQDHFKVIFIGNLVTSTIGVGLVIWLSLWLNFHGFFLGTVAAAGLRFLIFSLAIHWWLRLPIRFALDLHMAKMVFVLGAPMVPFLLAPQILLTIDRFVINHALGLESLGLYSLAVTIAIAARLLPISILGSYFPRYMTLIGAGKRNQVRETGGKLQTTIVLILVMFIGFSMLMVEPVIRLVLPEYIPALNAIRILLLSMYFYGTGLIGFYLHLGFKRMRRASVCMGVSIIAAIALDIYLVRYDISGVATGTMLSFAIYSLLISYASKSIVPIHGLLRKSLAGAIILGLLYIAIYESSIELAIGYFAGYSIVATILLWRMYRTSLRQLALELFNKNPRHGIRQT